MFEALTITTNGELTGQYGIRPTVSPNAVSVATYDRLDELKITATQLKIPYIMDIVSPEDILIDVFDPDEKAMISCITYTGNKSRVLVNAEIATAKKRMDTQALRFEEPGDGYISVLHGMLRHTFLYNPISEVIMSHVHNIATSFIYGVIVRSFDRFYRLIDAGEDALAAIRYGSACIAATKLFKLNVHVNDIARMATGNMFTRVNPAYYVISDGISTYGEFSEYLHNKGIMKNIDPSTIAEAFIRQLGYRALIILECGLDFLIDIMLCKSISRVISRNLFKFLGDSTFEKLQRNIATVYLSHLATKHEPDSSVLPVYQPYGRNEAEF